MRWVGALTMGTKMIILVCDGKLSTRPYHSLVKPQSIQYDWTDVCVGVLGDIPVDRHLCESTGGENDTNITDRVSIACGTTKLVGYIRDGAALCQERIHQKNGDN